MEKIDLICIGCPMGCPITVEMENGEVVSVTGNTCPRGDAYARKEVTAPTRTVTSTVRVADRPNTMVSVKTAAPVPKAEITAVMAKIRAAKIDAPVHIGDVVIRDVCGTDIVATMDLT